MSEVMTTKRQREEIGDHIQEKNKRLSTLIPIKPKDKANRDEANAENGTHIQEKNKRLSTLIPTNLKDKANRDEANEENGTHVQEKNNRLSTLIPIKPKDKANRDEANEENGTQQLRVSYNISQPGNDMSICSKTHPNITSYEHSNTQYEQNNNFSLYSLNVPPGRVGLVLTNTSDRGTIVSSVQPCSPMFGKIRTGDKIMSVNNVDVSNMTNREVYNTVLQYIGQERVFTILMPPEDFWSSLVTAKSLLEQHLPQIQTTSTTLIPGKSPNVASISSHASNATNTVQESESPPIFTTETAVESTENPSPVLPEHTLEYLQKAIDSSNIALDTTIELGQLKKSDILGYLKKAIDTSNIALDTIIELGQLKNIDKTFSKICESTPLFNEFKVVCGVLVHNIASDILDAENAGDVICCLSKRKYGQRVHFMKIPKAYSKTKKQTKDTKGAKRREKDRLKLMNRFISYVWVSIYN